MYFFEHLSCFYTKLMETLKANMLGGNDFKPFKFGYFEGIHDDKVMDSCFS
jgi:hypothetical protein